MKPTFLIFLTLFVTLSSPNVSSRSQKSTPPEKLSTPPQKKCPPKGGRDYSSGESYDKNGTTYYCNYNGQWEIIPPR